ncbi:MAG: putative glycosyltransferase (group 1) [Parcubacteria group bacterium Licking1014_17]|nr:MAG: putative glycosyltransferase (group 1) [Parcubacteria group bacterium Licking1014_17]
MKIAIFSDTFFSSSQINGVANVATKSAETLSELGHEVMVFTAVPGADKKKLKNNGKYEIVFCPSLPIGIIYRGERFALPIDFRALYKIRKFKPEIIHTHTPFTMGWWSILASKIFDIKLVGTHHTFYDHYLKHVKLDFKLGRWLNWKLTLKYYNSCDLVLSPSKALADEMVKRGLYKPVKVLANSVDIDFFKPATTDIKEQLKKKFGLPRCSLVYVGRVSYEKSIDQAIRAFTSAAEKNLEIKLMIVGDGPERKKIEKLATDLGIKDRMIFTGFLRGHDLREAFQASDIFITASKSENMPITMLEAMAVGLPFISVSEKGIPELVRHGINGFLSKADDINDMAKNILELCSNSDLLVKMSAASLEFVTEHSLKNKMNSLTDIYREVINGNGGLKLI